MDLTTVFLQAMSHGSSWSGMIIILIIILIIIFSIVIRPKYKKKEYNYELPKPENSNYNPSTPESKLNKLSNVVLWGGIVCTIFCLFTLTTTKTVDPTYHYSIHYDSTFNPMGLVISAGVLISSLVASVFLKVVANISETLKDINSKIK